MFTWKSRPIFLIEVAIINLFSFDSSRLNLKHILRVGFIEIWEFVFFEIGIVQHEIFGDSDVISEFYCRISRKFVLQLVRGSRSERCHVCETTIFVNVIFDRKTSLTLYEADEPITFLFVIYWISLDNDPLIYYCQFATIVSSQNAE